MGVLDLMRSYLVDLEPAVAKVLTAVILEEQRQIDMERPQIRGPIREIIDEQVRSKAT
jgi:hypothetical protein